MLTDAVAGKPAPLTEVARGAPRGLISICEQAMSLEKSQRFADGNAMAAALSEMMLNAVTREEQGASRWVAGGITVAGAVVALVTCTFVFGLTPTFRQSGFGGYAAVVLPLLAMSLLFLEWRTRARLKLESLVLALAASAVLFGFATTLVNFAFTLAEARKLAGDERIELLLAGFYEAVGPVGLALPLSALVLLGWAVVRRAVSAPCAEGTIIV